MVHAYLISGMAGVGKRTFAGAITQALLCQGDHKPCGVCPACVQVQEGTHLDQILVRPGFAVNSDAPGKSKTGISVDEIREVVRLCGEHTFAGGKRVVRIEQAEKMNPSAQNALLKTLEEPMEGTVFLLTSAAPSLLLQTIISRCRHLKLHAWSDDVVSRVLKAHGVNEQRSREAVAVSGGSIGQALAVSTDEDYWHTREEVMQDFFDTKQRSDIIRISTAWKDKRDTAEELLDLLTDMVHTLLMVRMGQLSESVAAGYPEQWQRMAKQADLSQFVSLLDAFAKARKQRLNQVTWQAVVEQLLLRLMEEKSRW